MIHPSTMAGPNWSTGSFGTTNPFQQNTFPFFRNTPFQGTPFGFGPGNNPFQNQAFGFGTVPLQNMLNEVVRQTVPNALASFGLQPTTGFPTPFGSQTPTGAGPFGPTFQTTPWTGFNPMTDWQTQTFLTEIMRQATNQAIQNMWQQNPMLFSQGVTTQTQPFFGMGTTNPFGSNVPQNLTNFITQVCQQACFQTCQTVVQAVMTCCNECLNSQTQTTPFVNVNRQQQQQNLTNFIAQVCQQACFQTCQTICQAVATCCTECLNPQTRTQATSFFNSQTTPFTFNTVPQYGVTSGIPTGAGAF